MTNAELCMQAKLTDKFWKTMDYEARANIAVEISRVDPEIRKVYDEAPSGAKEYWKWLFYQDMGIDIISEEMDFIDENIDRVCEENTDDDWDYVYNHPECG